MWVNIYWNLKTFKKGPKMPQKGPQIVPRMRHVSAKMWLWKTLLRNAEQITFYTKKQTHWNNILNNIGLKLIFVVFKTQNEQNYLFWGLFCRREAEKLTSARRSLLNKNSQNSSREGTPESSRHSQQTLLLQKIFGRGSRSRSKCEFCLCCWVVSLEKKRNGSSASFSSILTEFC